jgi:hypothetical protein
MALFGEKCARCGTRTRHEVDGSATCEACEKEMQLIVEAEGEAKRPCPIDGEWMDKEVAHMIVIDRCPKCHGVWLDGGELERIKGGVEATALMAMANGFTVPFN